MGGLSGRHSQNGQSQRDWTEKAARRVRPEAESKEPFQYENYLSKLLCLHRLLDSVWLSNKVMSFRPQLFHCILLFSTVPRPFLLPNNLLDLSEFFLSFAG